MNKMTRAAVLTAGLALTLTACGDDDGDGGELGLIDEGTLSVCSDIPYPPFEVEDADAQSGYSGFDMDLIQEIADRLDLELSVLITGFDAIESGTAVAADTCDINVSAMTITDERAENLGFSEPYFDSAQSLLVPAGSDLASLADFADNNLGVQGATTGSAYAQDNAPDSTEIIEYENDAALLQAIEAGNIDGILQDLPVNALHAAEGDFTLVETYGTDEQYGFAVKKEGKEALLEAVNEQLADIRDDGTYDEIYDRYFATN